MKRRWAVFASIAVFCCGTPSLAMPVTATLTPSIAAYVGPCPATIKFTGVISGDPGKKVNYQFARVMGGTTTLLPWTAGTIAATPTGGKLVVVDTVVVPAPKAGLVSDTLRVVPGPASVTATTSVTCVNPNATPTPHPNASPTANPNATPTAKPRSISPVLGSTVFMPNATPTPTQTPRFSPVVARVSLPTPTPKPHMMAYLPALFVLTSTEKVRENVGFGCQGKQDNVTFDTTKMVMGYLYTAENQNLGMMPQICWWHDSVWSRAAATFDLSILTGKKIWKAAIQFPDGPYTTVTLPKVDNTKITMNTFQMNGTHFYWSGHSCATVIGTGQAAWWKTPQWLNHSMIGTRAEFAANDPWNVTSQIQQWTKPGALNYGFVFAGGAEGKRTLDWQWGCQSSFAKPTLVVEYS